MEKTHCKCGAMEHEDSLGLGPVHVSCRTSRTVSNWSEGFPAAVLMSSPLLSSVDRR